MTDRKHPGVAFWATVGLTVAPVLYLLSIGPIIGILIRLPVPVANKACSIFSRTYLVPLKFAMPHTPKRFQNAFSEYTYFFQ